MKQLSLSSFGTISKPFKHPTQLTSPFYFEFHPKDLKSDCLTIMIGRVESISHSANAIEFTMSNVFYIYYKMEGNCQLLKGDWVKVVGRWNGMKMIAYHLKQSSKQELEWMKKIYK